MDLMEAQQTPIEKMEIKYGKYYLMYPYEWEYNDSFDSIEKAIEAAKLNGRPNQVIGQPIMGLKAKVVEFEVTQ